MRHSILTSLRWAQSGSFTLNGKLPEDLGKKIAEILVTKPY